MLAVTAFLLAAGLLGVAVTRALTTRHELAAAADLAALAGASALARELSSSGGGAPCVAAARVAAANGALLVGCTPHGPVLDVRVQRTVGGWGATVVIHARARAGPLQQDA